jgi:hypothetical protein
MASGDRDMAWAKWLHAGGDTTDAQGIWKAAWEEATRSMYRELNEHAARYGTDSLLELLQDMATRSKLPNWGQQTSDQP